MDKINSYNAMRTDGYQGGGSLGGGSNLLVDLEKRVAAAINFSDSPYQGGIKVDQVNPQEVRNYMSEIARQPLPGTSFDSLV